MGVGSPFLEGLGQLERGLGPRVGSQGTSSMCTVVEIGGILYCPSSQSLSRFPPPPPLSPRSLRSLGRERMPLKAIERRRERRIDRGRKRRRRCSIPPSAHFSSLLFGSRRRTKFRRREEGLSFGSLAWPCRMSRRASSLLFSFPSSAHRRSSIPPTPPSPSKRREGIPKIEGEEGKQQPLSGLPPSLPRSIHEEEEEKPGVQDEEEEKEAEKKRRPFSAELTLS